MRKGDVLVDPVLGEMECYGVLPGSDSVLMWHRRVEGQLHRFEVDPSRGTYKPYYLHTDGRFYEVQVMQRRGFARVGKGRAIHAATVTHVVEISGQESVLVASVLCSAHGRNKARAEVRPLGPDEVVLAHEVCQRCDAHFMFDMRYQVVADHQAAPGARFRVVVKD